MMKNSIIYLVVLFLSVGVISCSEETMSSTDNSQKTVQGLPTIVKKLPVSGNFQSAQDIQGFCFDFVYPIYVTVDGETVAVDDDSVLNEVIQTNGLEWFINSVDYPFTAANIVTSESNLGDVPKVFDGSSNDQEVGHNIVTSESNLGDVPKAIEVDSKDVFTRLLNLCK
jgi:hypothetical protein